MRPQGPDCAVDVCHSQAALRGRGQRQREGTPARCALQPSETARWRCRKPCCHTTRPKHSHARSWCLQSCCSNATWCAAGCLQRNPWQLLETGVPERCTLWCWLACCQTQRLLHHSGQAAASAASTQEACLCNLFSGADGLGALFEVGHHMVHCQGDASPQVHGVQPRCHRLAALTHNGPRQDCGRGGACRRVQVLVGSMSPQLGRVQQHGGALQTGSMAWPSVEACPGWVAPTWQGLQDPPCMVCLPTACCARVHLAARAWHADCGHNDAASGCPVPGMPTAVTVMQHAACPCCAAGRRTVSGHVIGGRGDLLDQAGP